ncbi:MAG: protein kinase [Candidatus Symbiothrix sp.]|jgi:serine/threonine protein kinase|nr:protein kinase [Candidatus Symbiothrix sp.]
MRAGETINGYEILKNSIPAGGKGEISFAKKGGTEYFIKVFLDYKYPVDGAPGSPKIKAEKRKKCERFEQHQKQLNDKIATKCAIGGNLVYAIDFFRCGTCYYKINEKIDIASLKPKDVSKFSKDKILILLKTVTHSLKILHDLGIVHGDLKPDNIIIKKTATGGYTTKLIDFDDSYFSENPPDCTEIVGTPDYYSPELLDYIKNTGKSNKKDLTTKSDIFTLGVIFTEYFSGAKPSVNETYSSVAQSVADGNTVKVTSLSIKICDLLNAMMQNDREKRPTISQVFQTLKSPDILDITKKEDEKPIVKPDEPKPVTTGTIRISGNLKGESDKKAAIEETPKTATSNPSIRISSNLKKS